MSKENTNTRIAKWDNAKAFLMLLVVFGHALTPYTEKGGLMHTVTLFLYSFHMPLFMFLSGLFSKSTVNSKPFKYEKVISYFLLFFVMRMSNYLILLLLGRNPAFPMLSEKGTPWYIFVFAVFILIARLFRELPKVSVLVTSVILSLAVGYIDFIGDTLMLSRIFTFFPFFFLGYMLRTDKLYAFLRKKLVKVGAVITLTLFIAVLLTMTDKIYSLRYVFTGNNPYAEYGADWYPYGALLRLFCYIVSLFVGGAVLALIPSGNVPLLSYMGKKTLSIYALHRQPLYILQYTAPGIFLATVDPNAVILISFAVSVVISILLSLRIWDYVLYPVTNWDKLLKINRRK